MTFYVNNELIVTIITFIFCLPLCCLGFWIYDRFYCKEWLQISGVSLATVSGLATAIAAVCVIIFLISSGCQRNAEPVTYQEYLTTQETLQQAIDRSEDIVNTDLYLRAVDFNSKLASIQKAQADSRYSMSFSGEVDWVQIPLIDLG